MTTTDHSRAVLAGEHSHGGGQKPQTSRAARLRSFSVADFPLPTGSEEEWRFSRLKDLGPALEDSASDGATKYEIDLAGTPAMPGLALGASPRGTALVPGDRAAVIASANSGEARQIRITAGMKLAEPVRIRVSGSGRENAHFVVEAEADSKAVVLFEHVGNAVYSGNVEVIVGDRAELTLVSLQLWDDGAIHVGQHEAQVGAEAKYRHINVTLGGKAVRLTNNAHYAGERGSAELLGVYYVDAGQHLEHQTYINHNAPNCVSRVTYKGALQGEGAHSVWIGDVLISAEAEGTDTYELNRNLVLTEGARADSVPNLEIETGEIEGAGHASATGRFDDEHLFYLQSRGIPEDEARKLVVRGFFRELVQRIEIPEIQDRLMELIEAELKVVAM